MSAAQCLAEHRRDALSRPKAKDIPSGKEPLYDGLEAGEFGREYAWSDAVVQVFLEL